MTGASNAGLNGVAGGFVHPRCTRHTFQPAVRPVRSMSHD